MNEARWRLHHPNTFNYQRRSFMLLLNDARLVRFEGEAEGAFALAASLPADVKAAINAVNPPPGEVFNVSPEEAFAGQVLRFERIQFASGASLTLSHEHDFVALVADELLFSSPLAKATVRFTAPPLLDGLDGLPGKEGAAGGSAGRGNHHGGKGGKGREGEDGAPGGEQSLPTLYILTNAVKAENPPSTFPFFTMEFDGMKGGDGGDGGPGGKGGKGGDGKRGKDGFLECKRGGGNAGHGGPGGPGGHGGRGGDAGDGADVVIIGPTAVIDRLKFSEISHNPGAPGKAGQSGASAGGGNPGARGGGTGFCKGGKTAKKGPTPPLTVPTQEQGAPGRKGTTSLGEVPDYHDALLP
ncbi:MAG TPA: hypothetical protein VKM72_03445 [Thermoanaerobaculia bacterium]|nr:hypothetical protein [Thermoanaerobaculia bacterium]